MLFGYFTLLVALTISAVAEFYSIVGLTAIFSAAFWPVVIMGASLGVGKITAAVWLKLNWHRARWTYKLYLVPAVTFLMVLTSMGIFGYLSKAHSDQSLVSGDTVAKIAIYDEKIKTERENIDANRKALKQLDEAVDQVMGRSSDEKGAERAVQIRRGQQAERGRLLKEIEQSQKRIASYNEERAPIAAEVRKVEAEVGPIKYIAALVYGDNPDANLLERAVRWVIILIVAVFDPLALVLILAAQQSLRWAREEKQEQTFQDELDKKREVAQALDAEEPLPVPPEDIATVTQDTTEGSLVAEPKYSYLTRGEFWRKPEGWQSVGPLVAGLAPVEDAQLDPEPEVDEEPNITVRQAMREWKAENPHSTLKEERDKLSRGEISELPWMAKIKTAVTFGAEFPTQANRGDTHVNTKTVPHSVYKWNGQRWIAVDKDTTDNYTYDTAYVRHLIAMIESGEYDPELLNENEREQVAQILSSGNT